MWSPERHLRIADAQSTHLSGCRLQQKTVSVIGGVDLFDAFLTLDFPHVDGLGISEYIRLAPGPGAE